VARRAGSSQRRLSFDAIRPTFVTDNVGCVDVIADLEGCYVAP
jgi:hypothetical protein